MRDSFDFRVRQEGGVTLFKPETAAAREFASDVFQDAVRPAGCYAVSQETADKVLMYLVGQRSFAISVDGRGES